MSPRSGARRASTDAASPLARIAPGAARTEPAGQRIGVMGGTFDPIHLGHLRAAEEIHRAFALDQIIFVPAARPPHKVAGGVASALHRYEMVSLATVFTPYFTVSSLELQRPGKSYSVDTLRALRAIYGPASTFYFILGVDAFLEMAAWKDVRELLGMVQLIVTARPGWRLDEVERSLTRAQLQQLAHPQFTYLKIAEITDGLARRAAPPGLICLVEVVSLDISSSEIRQLVQEGRSIRFLVTDTVAAYMAKNRLYQRARGSPA